MAQVAVFWIFVYSDVIRQLKKQQHQKGSMAKPVKIHQELKKENSKYWWIVWLCCDTDIKQGYYYIGNPM